MADDRIARLWLELAAVLAAAQVQSIPITDLDERGVGTPGIDNDHDVPDNDAWERRRPRARLQRQHQLSITARRRGRCHHRPAVALAPALHNLVWRAGPVGHMALKRLQLDARSVEVHYIGIEPPAPHVDQQQVPDMQ